MIEDDPIRTIETDLPLRILPGLRQRIWLIAAITLVGALISLSVARLLPPVYESSARILVESQQIPDALARSTITASAAERLTVIEQRLMTRENLLDIARRLDLFSGQPDLTPTEKVEHLRDMTEIESISFNANPRYRGPSHVSAFTISHLADDPRAAARVANEFVTMVIAQNITARSERASETHEFFRAEVARIAADLRSAEADIAAFKSQNRGFLPGTMRLRLAELSGLRRRLDRRARLIERLEGNVSAQSDVQAELSVHDVALQPSGAQDKAAQLPALRSQQEVLRKKIRAVQVAIDQTTAVEMDLGALQRRLDHLQDEHRAAVRKQAEAATGEKLELSRRAERFEVIEQASVPEQSVEPRRTVIAAAGVAGSLGLGIFLAILLELTSRTVRTARDMERLLAARPIAMIPHIPARGDGGRRDRWIGALLVLLGAGIISMLAFMPLDRLGLPESDLFSDRVSQLEALLRGLGETDRQLGRVPYE
ncbi:MAG: Wzz/FepE/Etk N-terminal domain-containing protein [Pseudomonadota bacterium]